MRHLIGIQLAMAVALVQLGGSGRALAADCHHAVGTETEVGSDDARTAFEGRPKPGTRARCVVMDVVFVVEKSTPASTYRGKTYVFCCAGCKSKFDADPASFVGGE
jgi:YHS domain-containing protein